jgi:hypothetical protein
MAWMTRTAAIALLLLLLLGCGGRESPYPEPADPAAAPVAAVDRFGDGYATLFKRSGPVFNPSVIADLIPAPDEPVDFDTYFLVRALGPAGQKVTYYALDISPRLPAPAYLVIGADGQPVAGQLPIVERLPGDEGYNDFVLVHEVHVGDDYTANAFHDAAAIGDAVSQGIAVIVATERVANWPLVPAASIATLKFDGAPVAGLRAWHAGALVHHLAFDSDLALTGAGDVPASNVTVIFENGADPSNGFATEPDGQTHNVVETLPGDPDYSSYWAHLVGRRDGFDSVTDWPSAQANFQEQIPVTVNCPVVAP